MRSAPSFFSSLLLLFFSSNREEEGQSGAETRAVYAAGKRVKTEGQGRMGSSRPRGPWDWRPHSPPHTQVCGNLELLRAQSRQHVFKCRPPVLALRLDGIGWKWMELDGKRKRTTNESSIAQSGKAHSPVASTFLSSSCSHIGI